MGKLAWFSGPHEPAFAAQIHSAQRLAPDSHDSHVLRVFHTMGLAAHTMGLVAHTIGLAVLLGDGCFGLFGNVTSRVRAHCAVSNITSWTVLCANGPVVRKVNQPDHPQPSWDCSAITCLRSGWLEMDCVCVSVNMKTLFFLTGLKPASNCLQPSLFNPLPHLLDRIRSPELALPFFDTDDLDFIPTIPKLRASWGDWRNQGQLGGFYPSEKNCVAKPLSGLGTIWFFLSIFQYFWPKY
jgi:hypothetical protein